MGSYYPPVCYDEDALKAIEIAYFGVWTTLTSHDPNRDTQNDADLRATIIKRLLQLAADGVTGHEQLRNEALRTVPLA